MNSSVFGREYADVYDVLYSDKNYDTECDLLEEIFQRYSAGRSVRTILDLGCGTGNHTIRLARRGYKVTGVDRSLEMLNRARQKAEAHVLDTNYELPAFCQGDVRQVDLGQEFDAVLMMFAVLGYQLTNDDVSAALCTVRHHLRPDGIFVCDVWYGPAVLANRPSERVKIIPTADGQVIRSGSGTLDIYQQLCEVRYHVWQLSGQHLVSESNEAHKIRYFFPQELAIFMKQNQLALVDIRAFGDLAQPPSEATWNVLVVGKSLPNSRI